AVGVIGVGVYHGAYVAEVVRAGIQSISRGQVEAAYSQGFNFWLTMRYVVLPQAVRVVLPPLTNQAIFLVKNTSVLAMVAGGDLMYQADSWAADSLNYGPAYVVTGLLYLAICFPLSRVARRLETRTEARA
ncbi:MAG TPA: amino acid ABC transporter permease, partial [Spirochaetia bacterium]|nr:amino acid ABC transporter permease [Spirochaetia bacterium]